MTNDVVYNDVFRVVVDQGGLVAAAATAYDNSTYCRFFLPNYDEGIVTAYTFKPKV